MGSPSPSIVRAWGRKATWRQEARLLASTKAAAQRLATAHGGELLLVYRPRAHPNLPSLEPDQVCRFLWQLKVVFYSLVFVVPVSTSTSVGTFYMKNLILFPTIELFYLVSIPCFFFFLDAVIHPKEDLGAVATRPRCQIHTARVFSRQKRPHRDGHPREPLA